MKLKVEGRFDRVERQSATITIDKKRALLTVRPFRSREYTLPLSLIGEIVVARVVKQELAK